MPIDPRIALGVQPVQMPDFMGYANQAANILQSRASEQNALALMAQRQRQEQEAMNVTNALRGFDPTNPAAVSRLYQMPGGAAEVENIFKAQEAQEKAKVAGMAASSARNESSLKRIASFNNWLQAWANIAEEEEKGLDPAKAGAVRQALRQAYNADPTPQGFENWKRQTMFGLLTPEQQLSTTRVTRNLGGTTEEEVVSTYGQQPGTRTFTPTMTPQQIEQLALDKQRLALEEQREARIAQETEAKRSAGVSGGYSNAQAESARGVLDKIDRLIGTPDNPAGGLVQMGETGAIGAVSAQIPGTTAYDVAKTLDSIKANIGFDRLQRMRDESVTGGALGQVAIREIEFLQATIDSLDQGQTTERLRQNLTNVRASYQRLINTMEAMRAEKAAAAGGGTAGVPAGIDPETWKYMTPAERNLFTPK